LHPHAAAPFARCLLAHILGDTNEARVRLTVPWRPDLMTTAGDGARPAKQLLHLVFGGELTSLDAVEFADLAALDIVGIYPNYAEAYKAWKAAAQKTVDNAQMRYFIVHMHRLLDPELTGPPRS
jgi:Domain of unknown function (DUF4170)